MGRIKNVVFDLGNVMINYHPRKFIEDLGYDKELGDSLCNAIFMDPSWGDMDRGLHMTYHEFIPLFCAHHPELEKEIRDFFRADWMDIYTVREDTERILYDWVKEKGLGIYILSNYAADGFLHVRNKFPFFRKMDGYVVSAFEKCVKPEPRIYRILLERYNLRAEECIFFDDVQENVDGAKAVGMNAVLFRDPVQARQTLIEFGV